MSQEEKIKQSTCFLGVKERRTCGPASCRNPTTKAPRSLCRCQMLQAKKPGARHCHFHAKNPDALARDHYALPRGLSLGRKRLISPVRSSQTTCEPSEGGHSHAYTPPWSPFTHPLTPTSHQQLVLVETAQSKLQSPGKVLQSTFGNIHLQMKALIAGDHAGLGNDFLLGGPQPDHLAKVGNVGIVLTG